MFQGFSPRGGQLSDARPAGARSTPGSTATRRTQACTRRCAHASTPGTLHLPRPRTASRRCCAACWAWTWTRPRRACSPASSRPRSARSPRCGAARALRQGEGRGRVSYPAPAVRRARAGSLLEQLLPAAGQHCAVPRTSNGRQGPALEDVQAAGGSPGLLAGICQCGGRRLLGAALTSAGRRLPLGRVLPVSATRPVAQDDHAAADCAQKRRARALCRLSARDAARCQPIARPAPRAALPGRLVRARGRQGASPWLVQPVTT